MSDRKTLILAIEMRERIAKRNHQGFVDFPYEMVGKVLNLLKEQDELLKHEYWRGYNNGRADERGLQEGTIMQTFSPD